MICMGCVAATTAVTAKLMKPIINNIFIAKDAHLIWPITGAVVAIFFLKGIFTYAESVLSSLVGNKMTADIQRALFQHVVQGDLKLFHNVASGDLVSRFMNDVTKLNSAVTGTLSSITKDFLTLVFFIGVMVDEDWKLSLVALVIFPIAILPMVRLGRRMRKTASQLQGHAAGLTVLLTEAFQGIRLIKSYCMEAYEVSRMGQAIQDVLGKSLKGARIKSATHPIMEFLGGVAIAGVIVYGGTQVIQGQQTPGAFFAFITALIMSYEPLKRLANLNANLQEQLAAGERVFQLLDAHAQIADGPRAQDLTIQKGHLVFQAVDFYYHIGHSVLRNIHLDIPAGQKVAIVGPSGSGKTTLFNLLLRFYDPTQGQIFIDGHSLSDFTLASLRRQISLVSQDVILFHDTIRANILFGKPDATQDEVESAAKAAAAHEFIMALPKGYDTPVGEQGVRLSGGQRQRISIARAILKNAPLLLLDEPTSALDSESEKMIQEALENLMADKTTLIIAHRLATVRHADCIYVLEHGRITGSGKHAQLLKSNAQYQQLCQLQFQEA